MQKEETWETVQIKTFVNWINSKLEKGEMRYKEEKTPAGFSFAKVSDLRKDLQDGLILHSLLYSLTGSVLRFNKRPVLVVHKRENIGRIIEYLKESKVEMVNIGAADIQEGSIKLTLALIWRFIMAFSLREIREDGENIKEKILRWCQRKVQKYGVTVSDFAGSWKDGRAISALVHSDVGGFVFDDGESEHMATRAIALAYEYLQVPPLIGAEDLVTGVCDEKSLLTYLIEYYAASIKNNGKIKRKLAEQAAIHAEQAVAHSKEEIDKVFALLSREIPDLQKKKKELDMAYNKVKIMEENAVRSTVSHIIQIDILHRMRNPYTPSSIVLPESFKHLPVVGVFDALCFIDTLAGWRVKEGEKKETPEEEEFVRIFAELLEVSAFVTFSGAHEFLKGVCTRIEEFLISSQKKTKTNDGKNTGTDESSNELSFAARETKRVMQQRLAWALHEVKDGIRRFNEYFTDDLKREKASLSVALSSEMEASSFPCPHKAEWSLLGGRDMYLRIVSDGCLSAGAREFITPITPDWEK
ncbi:hypothetical protein NEMIN01_2057 [Nematocida minor]|uniref:uncharacterized protein n=1 Tax=Nematocida minor TaxID=1912983 RepID=UPI00221EC614|nr:uncharacterized protein NEMIN01_2057 [Nematocida minor]KAI5192506.1 hypothetical protein NEMIN01_2057 [Nematocida minor]